ncbi:MAG: host attachment protein [Thermodesulfovibrionales bacterium]
MNRLIVAVDLGHFKAYRLIKEPEESPRLELIESYDTLEGHGRMSEKVSDSLGRFGTGGQNGLATHSGEPHNIELENSRRAVKLIARDINSLITKTACDGWYLAAGKQINGQILGSLDSSVRAKLNKNISLDLTKVEKSAILGHFE